MEHEKYSGHSFRIGAATTAAAKGIEDCIIKILGWWESLAYLSTSSSLKSNSQGTWRRWCHKGDGEGVVTGDGLE